MTEKDFETLLWLHHEKFFSETLKRFERQYGLPGGRPDIIFEDGQQRLLVIEVKLGRLQRLHIVQALDYSGAAGSKFPNRTVRIMLVANSITAERASTCAKLGIETIAVPEQKIREVAQSVGFSLTPPENEQVALRRLQRGQPKSSKKRFPNRCEALST